jgi:hypothetical protein
MTSSDLIEMEWLAAALLQTAARLQRATALLRAAGDLERLQARLAGIVAERPSGEQVRPGLAAAAVVGRSTEVHQVRGADSPTSPVLASRAFAVFDGDKFTPGKLATKSAGASRPPF